MNSRQRKNITKYDNKLNNLVQTQFTAIEMDLFWAIVTQLEDTQTNTAIFSYDELRNITGLSAHNLLLTNTLKDMGSDLLNLKIIYDIQDATGVTYGSRGFTAFTTFETNKDTKQLKIEIHEYFKPYINELTSEFTIYSLKQFIGLKSKYSKTLFRLLSQFKNTGLYTVSKEKLYILLDVPKSYYKQMGVVDDRIFKPAIDELTKNDCFKNLKLTKNYAQGRRGKPAVTGFSFTFDPIISDEAPSLRSKNKHKKIKSKPNYDKQRNELKEKTKEKEQMMSDEQMNNIFDKFSSNK